MPQLFAPKTPKYIQYFRCFRDFNLRQNIHRPLENQFLEVPKRFLTANDVADYMGISVPMAYKIIANLEYDYNYNAIFQYFNVRKTLRTEKGVCFDFAHLFAALCRSQNIPCYAVDGISYKDNSVQHTWNRVYYDGTWWNMDVTHDITGTAEGKELYGFRKLDGAFGPDEDFYIIKIY